MSKFIRIINADQVVEVKIKDQTLNTDYEYQPAKKHWLFPNTPEGFVVWFDTDVIWRETLEKCSDLVIIDNKVYTKPSVRIDYSDRKHEIRYFDTYDLAIAFSRTITNNIPNKVVIDQAQ